MKKIYLDEKNNRKYVRSMVLPSGVFFSDWFQCQKCGFSTQMDVKGDRATCYLCGGIMKRK